jgi:hypothetical protein
MGRRAIAVGAVITVGWMCGCGGKTSPGPAASGSGSAAVLADDCQRYAEKVRPVLVELAGKQITDEQLAVGIEHCRSEHGDHRQEPAFDCVLAAADAAAVRECIMTALGEAAMAKNPLEAQTSLTAVAALAVGYYVTNHAFPAGSSALTEDCCALPEHVCPAAPSPWATGLWAQIGFRIEKPHQFRYAADSTPSQLQAQAIVDMDCDGKQAVYTLIVTSSGGKPTATITTSGID